MAERTFYGRSKKVWNCGSKIVCLEYHPNFEKLIDFLQVLDIKVVFSYKNTIGDLLIKNSPNIESGIVYKIPCRCDSFYIGQTSVELKERIKQHKKAITNNDYSNACCVHYSKCNSELLWHQASILYKINDYFTRNFVESVCIMKTFNDNFNTSLGICKLDKVTLDLACKQFKINDRV